MSSPSTLLENQLVTLLEQVSRWTWKKREIFILLHLVPTVFPIITSNFDIDHFRSVGWFNMAFGVVFLFLQVVMFQGEYKLSRTSTINVKKLVLSHVSTEVKFKEWFCKIFVSQLNHANCMSWEKDLCTTCMYVYLFILWSCCLNFEDTTIYSLCGGYQGSKICSDRGPSQSYSQWPVWICCNRDWLLFSLLLCGTSHRITSCVSA